MCVKCSFEFVVIVSRAFAKVLANVGSECTNACKYSFFELYFVLSDE